MLWNYHYGLVLQGIYAVGKKTGDDRYLRWVKSLYDTKIAGDGGIAGYRVEDYNLDQINAGKNLFDLYKDFKEEKYRIAIETLRGQLRGQPRTTTGGFWHKQIYPFQMWLDGLYMDGPFYARYAAEFGAAGDFEDMVHQFVLVESKTRDEETGLLYHAWDEARKQRWADPVSGRSPHFWGRALGWYCMALVDALDFIPPVPARQEGIGALTAIANRLVLPVLKYQDQAGGLWYQILDKGGCGKNYLESSASSMFVYFLLKMIRRGLVPPASLSLIREAAFAGYQGLVQKMLSEDSGGELHLGGICKVAGLGGNPYRDGSFDYYMSEPVVTDDFKGVGPFILASLEREAALS
jgi:unsaturated rhamnogalacturonyl hydrolase